MVKGGADSVLPFSNSLKSQTVSKSFTVRHNEGTGNYVLTFDQLTSIKGIKSLAITRNQFIDPYNMSINGNTVTVIIYNWTSQQTPSITITIEALGE